jgi:hypothetical protein
MKPIQLSITGKNLDRQLLFIIIISYNAFSCYDKDKIDSTNKLPKDSEYLCELCMEKFDDSNKLQEHRVAKHKASTA